VRVAGWAGLHPSPFFVADVDTKLSIVDAPVRWTWTCAALSCHVQVKKGGSFLCHRSFCYRYRTAARYATSPDR
jgi:hypothetical protein